MKKTRVLAAATLSAALLLAGCAGTTTKEDGDQKLTVFAAASLQEAFDELLEAFGKEHEGLVIEPAVYEGSSTLVTQLSEGAEADVLATANEPTMDDAVAAGIPKADLVLFATNALVIAVAKDNPLNITDLPDVLGHEYAVCAEQVPCGNATQQLFEAANLELNPISEEQNVTSVANRVENGDVPIGFIYSTDVAARSDLIGIEPSAAQIINKYPIAATSDNPVAQQFVDFVLSDKGQEVLASYGFGRP